MNRLKRAGAVFLKAVVFILFAWFAYDSTVIALEYENRKADAIARGDYR